MAKKEIDLIFEASLLGGWLDRGAYGVPDHGWSGLAAILEALPSLMEIERRARVLHSELLDMRFVPDNQGGHLLLAGKIWRPVSE